MIEIEGWRCCLREMLWRQLRREVTHNELFQTVKSLLAAAQEFFDRYNREPFRTLSVIGSYAVAS